MKIDQDMPTDLKALLEFSSADTLFRLAEDHRIQQMSLLGVAWRDVEPVLDWYADQGKYDEAIAWLFENTPDSVPRSLAISGLIDARERTTPGVTAGED